MYLKEHNILPRLQFITHANQNFTLVESARKALALGVKWVQFRCKEELPAAELRQTARQVQQLCREHKALFVVDDRVELAQELQANGVHLGKNDMPVQEARKILGKDFLIGGTANIFEDMLSIARQGGNYIGLGPFRFTTTKEKLSPVLGLDGYKSLCAQARENGLTLPVFAIGGIRAEDAQALSRSGIYGIAVSSALIGTEQPEKQAEAFLTYFK